MSAQVVKLTAIGICFLFFVGFRSNKKVLACKAEVTYVYVCMTKNAYAYHHDYYCRGLNPCQGEKRKVTLEDAKGKYSRKLCGWED